MNFFFLFFQYLINWVNQFVSCFQLHVLLFRKKHSCIHMPELKKFLKFEFVFFSVVLPKFQHDYKQTAKSSGFRVYSLLLYELLWVCTVLFKVLHSFWEKPKNTQCQISPKLQGKYPTIPDPRAYTTKLQNACAQTG